MALELRKTRFVCISDTHNASFKLPKGDVLIHAGDLTKQGTFAELKTALDWIEQADFEIKIVIAGNHDITLDQEFYEHHGLNFHNKTPQDPQKCLDLIRTYHTITFLKHEAAHVRLKKSSGPQTSFRVFGSPYSPANGLWAFGYRPEDGSKIWEQIPLDTDIVVTHTPPKYHCDESRDRGAAGCEALRQILWRSRPSLAICGHVHEGRGVERIHWDLEAPNTTYKELATVHWEDPGFDNKKQSLVDLSSKSSRPLHNSGSWRMEANDLSSAENSKSSESLPRGRLEGRPLFAVDVSDQATDPQFANVRGQGGKPPSGRCDMEALAGRQGRKETCIINAAMMATSWPYKSKNAQKYNKPIVVDLDLPVWQPTTTSEISGHGISYGGNTASGLSA